MRRNDCQVPDRGFLVVRTAAVAWEMYYGQHDSVARAFLDELRVAAGIESRAYRGMDRYPLEPYPSRDPKVVKLFRHRGIDLESDRPARLALLDAMPADADDSPERVEQLLDLVEDAAAIVKLVDVQDQWEVILVARDELKPEDRTLGYDVGWWGGSFYSVLADTVVHPTWHGPPKEAFSDVAEHVRDLNEHVLFPDRGTASAFLAWYETNAWAEKNGFDIVRVDEVDEV